MMRVLFSFLSFSALTIVSGRVSDHLLQDLTSSDVKECNTDVPPIDFLINNGDANAEAIEDEVRNDLEALGFRIATRFLDKDDFNQARAKGDFGLSFSETWGSPYDPHSYVSSWEAENSANYHALSNLTAPASRDELLELIEDVLQEGDHKTRETKWEKVHEYYHQQAVFLPLWGRRIVAIINSRLTGYEAGYQQFDLPVNRLIPVAGSENSTVTISPGAQTGRFETVGNLDPHT
jgi:ABC-type transport system substrate-binding protein